MDHAAYTNASLIPSAMDLLLVFPRLAQRAGSFALYHMPEAVDNIAGKIFNWYGLDGRIAINLAEPDDICEEVDIFNNNFE